MQGVIGRECTNKLPSAAGLAGVVRTFKSKPAHTIPQRPRTGYFPKYPAVEALAVDDGREPYLAHRRIEAYVRPGRRAHLRRLRRAEGWIPGFLNARGDGADVLLRVPLAPLKADWDAGLFVLQKRGKVRHVGPLYELRVRADPEGYAEAEAEAKDAHGNGGLYIPEKTLRVQPMSVLIHPIDDVPVGVQLIARPVDQPVRVRIPVRHINEERCIGLRHGGWVNALHRSVDVQVAPGCRPPLYAVQDVGGLKLHGRATVGELTFEGKGDGCRTVLADDVACTIISRA